MGGGMGGGGMGGGMGGMGGGGGFQIGSAHPSLVLSPLLLIPTHNPRHHGQHGRHGD